MQINALFMFFIVLVLQPPSLHSLKKCPSFNSCAKATTPILKLVKKFILKYNALCLHRGDMLHKAVFLDKDGTIVDNSGYPDKIPTHEILQDKVLSGLKYLQAKGFRLFIVSNQPWIAKKRMTAKDTHHVFRILLKKLKKEQVRIHGYAFCPHHKLEKCPCRKPSPKMILQLAGKHSLDLKESYMVGDMEADIKAGRNSGIKTVLVKTGCGGDYCSAVQPDYVIENLNKIHEVIK